MSAGTPQLIPRHTPSAADVQNGSASLFGAVLDRLEEVLTKEIEALQMHDLSRLDEFTERKARILLELSRSDASQWPKASSDIAMPRLRSLRHKLELNRRLVEMQLQAADEISSILTRILKSADSDGTYAPMYALGAARR